MKKIIFSAFIAAACLQIAKAQSSTENHYRSAELAINFESTECHDNVNGIHKKLLLLEFANLTSKAITVNYDKHLWYNGNCTSCGSPEQHFTIKLEPNEVLKGSCDDKNKSLYIVDRMLNGQAKSALTNFELKNIQVETQE